MTIVYSIAIDRDHDGDFGGANEEINARVIELRWRLGMRRAFDSLADYGWGRIAVLNADGKFSPERFRLESGMRVRIQSEYASVKRTHFSGYISHIEPDAGDLGRKQALIHLQDLQPWLADSRARLSPQVDVTADQAIARLLDGATLRRSPLKGFCIIDVAGYNLIDSARIFPPENCERRLQAGKTRFAYVGDWWRETTSAREAIGEIAASERGRFYVDRAGRAVFLNRHHSLTRRTLRAAFDDDMRGMQYSFGDQRLNQIAVLMTPREVGEPGALLWRLRAPLRLGQHSDLLLNLRLVDERDQPIGLLDFDRVSARFQSGSPGGPTVRSGVSVEVAQIGGTAVQLRLVNYTPRPVHLTRLQVYGTPLYRRDPLEIVAADGEGMHIYGLKRLALDLPALSDIATARAFAAYELARRKHPRGRVHSLTLQARDQLPATLAASLFDRIRISEAQTGHSAREYLIIGEEHRVSAGGTSHELSWTLEPAETGVFIIVDQSAIDSQTELIAPY